MENFYKIESKSFFAFDGQLLTKELLLVWVKYTLTLKWTNWSSNGKTAALKMSKLIRNGLLSKNIFKLLFSLSLSKKYDMNQKPLSLSLSLSLFSLLFSLLFKNLPWTAFHFLFQIHSNKINDKKGRSTNTARRVIKRQRPNTIQNLWIVKKLIDASQTVKIYFLFN